MRSPSLLPLAFRPRPLFALLVVITLLVGGCATRRPAPVEDRAVQRMPPAQPIAPQPGVVASEVAPTPTYTVKRGDTLHQIALDNGLDYRELAAWNNIENVNRIFPGQVLRLAAPGEAPVLAQPQAPMGVTTTPLRSVPAIVEGKPAVATPHPPSVTPVPPSTVAGGAALKTAPKALKEPYSEQAVRELNLAASAAPAPREALALAAPGGVRSDARPEPVVPPAAGAAAAPPTAPGNAATGGDADQLDWAWPAKGKIVAGFSETANLKGIDIAGAAGEAVRASAPGRVVYAGAGLRGYGKLIIIKHNATFLSAYAHNREILVKEGQQVTRGQKIAEMGNTDAEQVKLHFEIRRHGKPMDPTKYLPPA
jgi:lipoprotein NlpD